MRNQHEPPLEFWKWGQIPIFHPAYCSRFFRVLVYLKETALGLFDDGVVSWLEVLEELVDIFGINENLDMETETRAGHHGDLQWRLLAMGRFLGPVVSLFSVLMLMRRAFRGSGFTQLDSKCSLRWNLALGLEGLNRWSYI